MSRAPSRTGETGTLGLWFAALAGALAWSAHLLVSYVLLPLACGGMGGWLLHGVTAATLGVALAGGWVGWRYWKADPVGAGLAPPAGGGVSPAPTGSDPAGGSGDWRRFMGLAGVLLDGLFGVAIMLEGLPVAILSPCL
jgi:hypothetical protein